METFMSFYGIFWFFMIYAIPCCLFVGFYGRVLHEVRRRRRESRFAIRVMDKMNAQLTRTLIIVTILFAITLGWDSWYYLLGYLKVLEYNFNSPMQIMGVFLSVMNSCLNPVVYLLTMPMFRKSVRKTLNCFVKKSQEQEGNVYHINELVGIVNPGFVFGIGYPECEICNQDGLPSGNVTRQANIVHLETVEIDVPVGANVGGASSTCERCTQEVTHKSHADITNLDQVSTTNVCEHHIENESPSINFVAEANHKPETDSKCHGAPGRTTRTISISSTHHHVISASPSLQLSPFPFLSNVFTSTLKTNVCVVPYDLTLPSEGHQNFCRSSSYQSNLYNCHCLPIKTKGFRKSFSLEETPVKGIRVVFHQST